MLVFAGLLVSMWLWINPNDYKNRIAQAVKESTGRESAPAPGPEALPVFPGVAAVARRGRAWQPAGLRGHLHRRCRTAARTGSGRCCMASSPSAASTWATASTCACKKMPPAWGYWQNLGARRCPAGTAAASSAHWLQGLDGLSVTHGQVSFGDLVAEQIHFVETGCLVAGGVVPLSLSLVLTPRGPRAPETQCRGGFERRFQRPPLAPGGARPERCAGAQGERAQRRLADLGAGHERDGGKDTLSLPAFAAELDGAHLSGALEAVQITQAPERRAATEPRARRCARVPGAPRSAGAGDARSEDPHPGGRRGGFLLRSSRRRAWAPHLIWVDDTRLRGEARCGSSRRGSASI